MDYSTVPHYMPEWNDEDHARMLRMEELYKADGRDNPDHPFHMLYTGLRQQLEQRAEG